MTENSYKEKIRTLRLQGNGYKAIARELKISKNTVVYHCRTLGLIGVQGLLIEKQTHNCIFCFAEMKNNNKYCSSDCRKLAKGKNNRIKCVACEKIFIGNKRKFCSIECSKKISDKLPAANKKCLYCNVDFTGKVTSKFCSKNCGYKHLRQNKRHVKNCGFCHDAFKTNDKKQKFCSTNCQHLSMKNKKHNFKTNEKRKQKDFEKFLSNLNIKLTEFTYVSGYENSESTVSLQCKSCSNLIERNAQIVRRNKKTECEHCIQHKKTKEIEMQKRQIVFKKLQIMLRQRIGHLKRIEKQNQVLHCKNCGKGFTRTNLKRKIFCSDICFKRFSNKTNEIKRRKKIYSNGEVDYSITLEKLIKKHNKKCVLCNDKVILNKGYQHPLYPSIDHIIPVSKGGTHTWDNVQLAHRGCNSEKSNQSDVRLEKGMLILDL